MIRRSALQCVLVLLTLNLFSQKDIKLEDIYSTSRYQPQYVMGLNSMADGKLYSVIEGGYQIALYDYLKGEKQDVIFSLTEHPVRGEHYISNYEFSGNESRLLFSTSIDPVYRHSFLTSYFVYDRLKKKVIPVFERKQQYAKISPDGKQVAFVADNNLYIKDLDSGNIVQVTYDGEHASVINGMPDWVYEEEFTLTNGFEWSPDSKHLAYYRFDESQVREYQLTLYESLYPEYYRYKYPKAGENNSLVAIHIYNLGSQEDVTVGTGENTDIYIPRIKWSPSSQRLCVIRLNRHQNKAELLLANTESGETEVFYTEENEKFISEFSDDFATFLEDGQHVLIMSEKDGYMHFYLYSTDGKFIKQVTKGKWEVDEFLGVDEKKKVIYFTSTEVSPLERHIYAINYDGKNKTRLSQLQGTHSGKFNAGFEYYIDYFSSANQPLNISLYTNKGKKIRVLEDNSGLVSLMKENDFVPKEFFEFDGPGGETLYGFMYKPQNLDPEKKYPLFMYVYGGPESQDVTDSWDRNQPWFQYLVQQGYIVACIDNRGTDGRGEAFKKSTYLQLGKYETEDQIAAAKYLGKKSYIDENRIGIFGWSYGGYMSLLCLMKGNDVFKMGIAVAPVTNWRYYDTIYTERFMRKPQENGEGYDSNSPINYVEKLKGKLLLIHGTADDNVHVQNSMMLIGQLVNYNKDFEMYFYPNKNHGIYGGNTRLHLFSRISGFISENL